MPKQTQLTNKRKARSLDPLVPSTVAELVCRDVIDLTGVSTFCRPQAEWAALITEGIEQRAPMRFVLKSPFRENFMGSLHVHIPSDAPFSPAETIALSLRRHAERYLGFRDIDRIRRRFNAELSQTTRLEPAALKPIVDGSPVRWWEGFIGAGGKFAIKPDKEGTRGIFAFQAIDGDDTSLALEIRGVMSVENANRYSHTTP